MWPPAPTASSCRRYQRKQGVQWGGSGAGTAGQGGCLLLSGLSGLWGYEMTPDLFIPLRVQSRLHQNCSELIRPINDTHDPNDTTWCDWSPFGKNGASCFSTPHSPPQEGASRARKALQGQPSTIFLSLSLSPAFRQEQLQGVTGGRGQCLPRGLCYRHVHQVRQRQCL